MTTIRQIPETVFNLIRGQMQTYMTASIASVQIQRNDGDPNIEKIPNENYFNNEDINSFRFPACYIIVEKIRNRKAEKEVNHVNSTVDVRLGIICEERNSSQLQLKTYRYHDAAHQVLDNLTLTSSNSSSKCFVRVEDADFSEIFMKGTSGDMYRKEVIFNLSVDFWQNF